MNNNRNAVVPAPEFSDVPGTTALRLGIINFLATQRSRSGNVGLEAAAPLGHPPLLDPALYQ